MLALLPTDPPIVAEQSWTDIGRTAILDLIHGLTGGKAATDAASKLGDMLPGGSSDAAAIAAARRAADAAAQKKMIYVFVGIGGAVVLGALLLRR
jgi:hypothetical protein